jgi:mitogen-activated protein kinase kinase
MKRPKPLSQVAEASSTPFANFSNIVDPTGNLNFTGKASLGSEGIKFENGQIYSIQMEDFKSMGTLGGGQFGVVQKVLHKPTNLIMALKEIRLELDKSKLDHIIMELEILHKSRNSNIIDFFGACVLENCVYMSIEYMDAGSLDTLYSGGIPENVLKKIASSMLNGLAYLKSELNVIHRGINKLTRCKTNKCFGQHKRRDQTM